MYYSYYFKFPSLKPGIPGYELHKANGNEHGDGSVAYVRCDLPYQQRACADRPESYFLPVANLNLRKVCHSKLLIGNNYFKGEEVNSNTIEKGELIS